jgi:hypothetical protein
MRYELTNDERTAIMPMLPNKPGVRPPCPQRHLLCCAPGRHGETCRIILLQPLDPLAACWRLGQDHERPRWRP